MPRKRLRTSLTDGTKFTVTAEMVGGVGYNFGPIEKFLSDARDDAGAGIPDGFNFAAIMSPQNPGGAANIDPSDVLARMDAANLLDNVDFVPHISCKDHNSDAIISSLAGFAARGVESVLVLTGDKPVSAQKVFELDSVTLLQLIQKTNYQASLKASPGRWDSTKQFFAGAAVSPFKYTEASQILQYYKMEKKITCGAGFLVTQVGWDWKKSIELMRYLHENNLDVPVIGNVYFLTTATPAPRLMHTGKLPGCFVSDALMDRLKSENIDRHIARAAQQVAMYKAIGARGVDVGGVGDYGTFTKILNAAAQIGDDWERYKDNLCWPADETFYLYDDDGNRVALSGSKKKFRQRCFNFMHRLILDPAHAGFKMFRWIMRLAGTEKQQGFIYKTFNAFEKAFKYAAFDCEECGDCYLPENFGYCSIGLCEKGMANPPCGDSTVDGQCGNNTDKPCVAELIYQAASTEQDGREQLRTALNKPRDPALRHTSSVLNYLFGRDHTKSSPLITIGEAMHAAVPKINKVMKELDELSDAGGPLNYIKALIGNQAGEGADYILVNIDALGDGDAARTTAVMTEYIRLIAAWGKGTPPCIDSAVDESLVAGLKEWYAADGNPAAPLVSCATPSALDAAMPLRGQYDFAVMVLLTDGAGQSDGAATIDAMHAQAVSIYQKARQYGFEPGQIFFTSNVTPLASDKSTGTEHCSDTYITFEAIRKIRGDRRLKGTHFALPVAWCAVKLPDRTVGICRAYVAKAMEYGLDSAVTDVGRHYGESPADVGLEELVDAFARMDGSVGRNETATTLMDRFCAATAKPKK